MKGQRRKRKRNRGKRHQNTFSGDEAAEGATAENLISLGKGDEGDQKGEGREVITNGASLKNVKSMEG